MMDILLVGEITWCMVLIGQRTIERTLLYLGGLVASGYVASISAHWAANVLLGHSNAAMAWFTSQIQAPAEPVGILATTLPPASTIGGQGVSLPWIALHVAAGLLAFLMTIAVFAVFVVVSQLIFALWDFPEVHVTGMKRILSYLFGFGGGIYIAFLTGTTLANLAWLRPFSIISETIRHSILLGGTSTLISIAEFYGLHPIG